MRRFRIPHSAFRIGLIDGLIVGLAYLLAFALQFYSLVFYHYVNPHDFKILLWKMSYALPFLVVLRLFLFSLFGMYQWSYEHASLNDALRILKAIFIGSLLMISGLLFLRLVLMPAGILDEFWAFKRLNQTSLALLIIEPLFTSLGVGASRFSSRLFSLLRQGSRSGTGVLIWGAGETGARLARHLLYGKGHSYRLIGFVDDDPSRKGMILHGYKVLGLSRDIPELVKALPIQTVMMAAPQASGRDVRAVLESCQSAKVAYKVMSLAGMADPTSVRDISVEDLLERKPVTFDVEELHGFFHARHVLITGAGGSIGSELARQIASHHPAELSLLDMNENALCLLELELRRNTPALKLLSLVADIRDKEAMTQIFQSHRPQVVFHAAAHKHVHLMELNPAEAVKNNVFGTHHVADAAQSSGVETFILISSDKAVNPTSVMGATKRVAEILIRDHHARGPGVFLAVRFGNVLGSSGSVVPIFQKQIEMGGPVTVTHRDAQRYFMTIPEAVGLVIVAGVKRPGSLCILDMGEPVPILTLARNLITLSGKIPETEIPIVFTGLRPGEKLHEELLTEKEEITHQVVPGVHVVDSCLEIPANLDASLQALKTAADKGDAQSLLKVLSHLVPTYRPS